MALANKYKAHSVYWDLEAQSIVQKNLISLNLVDCVANFWSFPLIHLILLPI